jgi:hypothetical protein
MLVGSTVEPDPGLVHSARTEGTDVGAASAFTVVVSQYPPLEQVPTFGGHSQFPPGKLDELLAGIGAAIDAKGGSFTMEYAAVVVTATRIGDRHR